MLLDVQFLEQTYLTLLALPQFQSLTLHRLQQQLEELLQVLGYQLQLQVQLVILVKLLVEQLQVKLPGLPPLLQKQ